MSIVLYGSEQKNSYQAMLYERTRNGRVLPCDGIKNANVALNFVAEIKSVYSTTFGKVSANEEVYFACYEYLCENAKNVSFMEIRIAFSLVCANVIDCGDVTPYYGEPSLKAFSAIINAYKVYVASELKKAVEALPESTGMSETELERRNKQAIQDSKKVIFDIAQKFKQGGELTETLKMQIIGFMPELVKSGNIVVSDEKKQELANIAMEKTLQQIDLLRASQDAVIGRNYREYRRIIKSNGFASAIKQSKEILLIHRQFYSLEIFNFVAQEYENDNI